MILKVAQVGHPVLRQRSREVTPEELASGAVQQFMDDLLETMDEYDGVGLAAPQVHVPLRIVALQITGERGPEFLVNPRITVLADTTRKTWEGCLSVEGFRGLVIRPDHVRIEALDRDGSEKVLEIKGHGAVVVQHECDHLDGVLYIDRAEPRSLVTTQNFRRYGPPEEYADEEADVDDEGMDDLDEDELDELDEDALEEVG
ncbi:MAG: peptide deformylase [Alphaproteobacteria bacterium]|nr:peptide deformylase [Alphaproteobacteria bacterium]MCB9695325.1 peptide deformylase [Alphaproteobacteria bacterium]